MAYYQFTDPDDPAREAWGNRGDAPLRHSRAAAVALALMLAAAAWRCGFDAGVGAAGGFTFRNTTHYVEIDR
jgi:hypothetical protein